MEWGAGITAKGVWHPQHDRCAGCGTTTRPHLAEGRCVACWRAARGLPPRRPGEDEDDAIVYRPAE